MLRFFLKRAGITAADPYLTAKQLGIKRWERDGLVALIPELELGGLAFDAAVAVSPGGNVACIGGWLAIKTGRSAIDYMAGGYSQALWILFWPDLEECLPTAHQAARAIHNFLMTGDPQWESIMRV